MNEWEKWIADNLEDENMTAYDRLIELVISSYELKKRSRKQELKDKVHFFIEWWYKNREKTNKYKSYEAIGSALGFEGRTRNQHGMIVHYIHHRKKSHDYNSNTSCVRDFLS